VLPPPIGAVKSYRLKDKRHAGLLPAVAGSLGVANSIFLMFVVALLPACSKNVQPVLLKEVGDNSGMARKGGLYFYKPGSILDEYVTLELNVGAERITLMSVAECSWAGAKFTDKGAEIISFRGDLSLRPPSQNSKVSPMPSVELTAKVFDREPSDGDVDRYSAEGYSMVECKG